MKKMTLAGAMIVCSIALCACGKNAKKLNNTGIEYYNAEQYDKAVKAFEEAVDKDKDGKAEYNVNLGKAYAELGNYEEAEKAFMAAYTDDKSSKEAQWGIGVCSYFLRDYATSMEYFGKVVENISDYDEIDLDSLQYYASLQTYYGDSAGAIDSYTVLIRKNYNVEQQYFLRGGIYAEQGMENEAVLDYEEALKEYSDDYEMYYNIYYSLHKAGFENRAISYLRRALDVDGADNFLKGKTYYIIGDYENAMKFLSKAIDDGMQEAEFYLAMTYEKLGKSEEAVSMYEAYLKSYPSDAGAYNQYGVYCMNKGDYNSALGYFAAGLALGDTDAKKELMFNQACCYEYMYQFKSAYEKFGEYLELYPNDEAARHEYEFLSTR